MKWVVAALVLLNIGLFMWGRWYHEPLVALEVPRPPVEVAPDKMKLLNEAGAYLVVRARTAERPPQIGNAELQCYRLGPFPTLEKARTAGALLGTWGLAYERIAEFQTLGPAYRVVIPPLPSARAVEQRRRQLTKLGFTDHAVIQQEEGMENAISLGVFTVERNARALVQELRRKGVAAQIQPVPNLQPVYWLAVAGATTDGRLADVPLQRFEEENWGAPGVQLRPHACGE